MAVEEVGLCGTAGRGGGDVRPTGGRERSHRGGGHDSIWAVRPFRQLRSDRDLMPRESIADDGSGVNLEIR
uniref:Uncharacterized protein n=1 Tax=Oryza brachyantha TaxID=4533 RepID=J3N199_ORYBR